MFELSLGFSLVSGCLAPSSVVFVYGGIYESFEVVL